MSTQKRKVGAENCDSEIDILDSSDSSSGSADAVNREIVVEEANKKPKLNNPSTITSKMRPKHQSTTESPNPTATGSGMTGTNNGPNAPGQPIPNLRSELKEINRKLDILLSWVGKLKRGAALQSETKMPAQPKAIRRAATTPDFHFN
ncbi:hypothetical protein FRC11_001533 [Ceratobasidium sp. 423]|nr:hypothetical protein FRC11_001533 [Ceratobasidium sp. 423]